MSYNKLSEWMSANGCVMDAQRFAGLAIEPIARAAAMTPDDYNLQYNLACARARLGQTQEALAALARSVELGNSNADWAAQDPDLRSLRGLPEFESILARMREQANDIHSP